MDQVPCPICGAMNAPEAHACADCWTDFPAGAAAAAADPSSVRNAAPVAPAQAPSAPTMAAPAPPSPFVPAPPTPPQPMQGGYAAQPGYGAAPPTAPKRSGGRRIGGIVVGVIAAAIAATVVRGMLQPSIHLPDTLAGQPKITTGDMATGAEDFKTEIGKEGMRGVDAAGYGDPASPSFVAIVAPGTSGDLAGAYSEFQSGFNSGSEGSGSTLTVGEGTERTAHDLTLICGVVTAQGQVVGAACGWSEGTEGFVLSLHPGQEDAAALAVKTQEAIP